MLPYFFAMLQEELRTEIAEVIGATLKDAFVVDMKLKRGPQSSLLIQVDTDKGITMAQCADLSRAVGAFIDEKDLFDFSFNLELSSPGVGSPLKLHRQYVNNVGRFLNIRIEGEDKETKGKLLEVSESSIRILPLQKKLSKSQKKKLKGKIEEPKERNIDFSDILEAKVIII